MSKQRPIDQNGFSLLELLVTLLIGASLLTGLSRIIGSALNSATQNQVQQALTDDAQFAVQRMRREVMRSNLLLLPTREVEMGRVRALWPT